MSSARQKMDLQFIVHSAPDGRSARRAPGRSSSAADDGSRPGARIRCDQCGKTYSLPGNLNKHVKTAHRNERPHVCSVCRMPFHFKDGLTRHINLVHSQESLPYRCEACGATFKQRSHLAKHENRTHKPQR